MKKIFLFTIAICYLPISVADEILLRIDVIKQIYTDYYPKCKGKNCISTHFWFVHEASVKQVITGKYEQSTVKYANLQHANFIDEYVTDIYVILKQIKNKELRKQLGVSYYIKGFHSANKIVCLPTKFVESFKQSNEKLESPYFSSEKESCYLKKWLDYDESVELDDDEA